MKKVSLIYAAGTLRSRGGFLGFLLGGGDGVLLGQYRGTTRSRLAASLRPPRKAPYGGPILLWFLGYFPVLSLIVNKIHSPAKGILALGYFALLPTCILAALFYNILVRPRKVRGWEHKFICFSCGAFTDR